MGSSLLVLCGAVLGIVLGILIMVGAIPLFREGKKKKNASGNDSLQRPT
jgi:hypothetical protein